MVSRKSIIPSHVNIFFLGKTHICIMYVFECILIQTITLVLRSIYEKKHVFTHTKLSYLGEFHHYAKYRGPSFRNKKNPI